MSVSVVKESAESITLELTVNFNRSMLDTEAAIQTAINEAGNITTSKLLKQFDSDGSPIVIGSTKLTSMGLVPKRYQSPMEKSK